MLQRFLQLLLANPSISEIEFKRRVQATNDRLPSEEQHSGEEVLAYARERLAPLQLDLRAVSDRNFAAGTTVLQLISLSPLPASQLPLCGLTAGELSVLRQLVDEMFANSKLQGAKGSRHPQLTEQLCAQGRLVKLGNGRYMLSTGCATEISQYLKQFYKLTLFDCGGCGELVLKGELCPQCDFRLHEVCAPMYAAANNCAEGTCGQCGASLRSS